MVDKGKKKNKLVRITIAVIVILLILMGAFYVYTLDYYRASDDVHSLMTSERQTIETDNKITVVKPTEENDREIGLIFYPG